MNAGIFPEDSAARKEYPVYSGLLQYFPSALAAIANHSFKGNEKHNPGLPLHHDRAKSSDEPDALVRHLMEGDYVGMAWRALSLLQKHCEAQGAPVAPSARNVARQLYDEAGAIAAAQDAKLDGIPAESAYLAREVLTAEELKGFGIGDVELPTLRGIPDSFIDSHGNLITRRHVAETATTVATSQHPMAAETLRNHDERLDGPEDRL